MLMFATCPHHIILDIGGSVCGEGETLDLWGHKQGLTQGLQLLNLILLLLLF